MKKIYPAPSFTPFSLQIETAKEKDELIKVLTFYRDKAYVKGSDSWDLINLIVSTILS